MSISSKQLAQLQVYFDGEMTPKQLEEFEAEIQTNAELSSYIATAKAADAFLSEQDWVLTTDTKAVQEQSKAFLKEDVQEFARITGNFIKQKNGQPKRRSFDWGVKWITAISAVLVVAFIYSQFFATLSLPTLYDQQVNWNELPSFTTKSGSRNNPLIELEKAFQAQNYKQTITLSQGILDTVSTPNTSVLLYMGAAQLELDQYAQALASFNKVSRSESLDAHMGYWYTAMVFLKQGNKNQAIRALKRVESDSTNYKYKQALELLEQLD